MPVSISAARHPVGIIIQNGLSQTTTARRWSFLRHVAPTAPEDDEPWRRSGPNA
ncbi:MAG: hypothetical protein R2909_19305 [Gemmatimonadales bacterium]